MFKRTTVIGVTAAAAAATVVTVFVLTAIGPQASRGDLRSPMSVEDLYRQVDYSKLSTDHIPLL
jgi:hypothetical protein